MVTEKELIEYINDLYELWLFRKDLHKDDQYAKGRCNAYRDLLEYVNTGEVHKDIKSLRDSK